RKQRLLISLCFRAVCSFGSCRPGGGAVCSESQCLGQSVVQPGGFVLAEFDLQAASAFDWKPHHHASAFFGHFQRSVAGAGFLGCRVGSSFRCHAKTVHARCTDCCTSIIP